MNKDQKDIKLLDKSIAHWKRMRAWTLEQWGEYSQGKFPEQPCDTYCALCQEYFPKCKTDGCPVYCATDYAFCQNSPYENADHCFSQLELAISCSCANDQQLIQSAYKSWQHAAGQEIAFLAKLRDELKKKVARQARPVERKSCRPHRKSSTAAIEQKCP